MRVCVCVVRRLSICIQWKRQEDEWTDRRIQWKPRLTEVLIFWIVLFAVRSETTPACCLQTCSPVSELRSQFHVKCITEEKVGSRAAAVEYFTFQPSRKRKRWCSHWLWSSTIQTYSCTLESWKSAPSPDVKHTGVRILDNSWGDWGKLHPSLNCSLYFFFSIWQPENTRTSGMERHTWRRFCVFNTCHC